jgi:hypothetical protein
MAMGINDEPDDLTDDDDLTAVQRARARDLLDQIVQQTNQALIDTGIDLDLFFLIPNSGNSILTFGTPADPDDTSWNHAGEIVASIVQKVVGLDRVRCRQVTCATTDSIADASAER